MRSHIDCAYGLPSGERHHYGHVFLRRCLDYSVGFFFWILQPGFSPGGERNSSSMPTKSTPLGHRLEGCRETQISYP